MTIRELIKTKEPSVIAKDIQYIYQHHTGLKICYSDAFNFAMEMRNHFDEHFIDSPLKEMTLEDFVAYAIVEDHEELKNRYVNIP